MKILQINAFGNLSTGRIAVDIYRTLLANGHESQIAYARNSIDTDVNNIKIGTELDIKIHGLMTRITDKTGFYSKKSTKDLIEKIKEYNPDIIHIHNIHGYYINIELLFNYFKECEKPVVWTLHDCWSFTGHCCYFEMAGCELWKTGCHNCPQKASYPQSIVIDNSSWNYNKKKELFTGVNMTLVAVSEWLGSLVKESFLKNQSLEVIYNGIDLNIFKPTASDFREKYGLQEKFIILGVASTWDIRKGLKDFIQLSKMLNDDYKVVVVGVNEKERASLPENMIGIPRTNSVRELAGLYTTADVFFNASVEETFGLPTVEAMACGTPVIVYDATASPEIVDTNVGFVVQKNNLQKVLECITNCEKSNINPKYIRKSVEKFDKNNTYRNYINLYKGMLGHD